MVLLVLDELDSALNIAIEDGQGNGPVNAVRRNSGEEGTVHLLGTDPAAHFHRRLTPPVVETSNAVDAEQIKNALGPRPAARPCTSGATPTRS